MDMHHKASLIDDPGAKIDQMLVHSVSRLKMKALNAVCKRSCDLKRLEAPGSCGVHDLLGLS